MSHDGGGGGCKNMLAKVGNILSNFTKGGACFEIIPDRRYALMKTARHSHWWEVYDLQVGRRLTAFKTMETHAGVIDTYALPAAIAIDAFRISLCVYRDEGVGPNVLKTGSSIAGAWIGGYFAAQFGYKAGEVLGGLVGPSHEGVAAVIFGYVGGVVGAQYGDKLARYLFLHSDD